MASGHLRAFWRIVIVWLAQSLACTLVAQVAGQNCATCFKGDNGGAFDDGCTSVSATYSGSNGNCTWGQGNPMLCGPGPACKINVQIVLTDKGCQPPPTY